MKRITFRGQVALWSVAVATITLTLFGAGAAWNLRRELVENFDREMQEKAAAFAVELDEQSGNESPPPTGAVFSTEDLPRFPYVEVRDAQRLLYRSPALGKKDVFPREPGTQPNEVTLQGRRVRFRVFRRGAITFALGKDLQAVDEALAGLWRAYLITLPLVVIAVGAGGWLIARRAVAPIQMITAQARKISVSDLHQRMPAPAAADEIGHLTEVLNDMFDRLQRSFEQVTRFTSDASHELKTPLALMQAQVESASHSLPLASEQRELLSDVGEQCTRLTQIVDGLLFLSRADDRHLALAQVPLNLVRLVRELMEDAEILAEPAGLSLECQLPEELMALGDRRLLARAFMNLIDNAIKHNQPGGRLTVAASAEESQAVLRIGNTGPGLPKSAAGQLFDRVYRGDSSQGNETPGHGLGLSIAREIARAHGGDIQMVCSDSQWTEFCLILPLAGAPGPSKNGLPGHPSAQCARTRGKDD
ncbi:MAG: ATP-binding protein [Chthoniobacterales bacterium]